MRCWSEHVTPTRCRRSRASGSKSISTSTETSPSMATTTIRSIDRFEAARVENTRPKKSAARVWLLGERAGLSIYYLAANSPPMFNPYSQLFDFIVIHFPAIHLQRKYLVSYSYFFLVPTKPVWANSYLGIHPVISWVFLEPAIFMPRSFASNQWYLPKSISVVL